MTYLSLTRRFQFYVYTHVSLVESNVYGLGLRIQKINNSEAVYSVALNDSSTPEFKTLAESLTQVVSTCFLTCLSYYYGKSLLGLGLY